MSQAKVKNPFLYSISKTGFVFSFVGLNHILMMIRDLVLAHQFGNGPDLNAFLVMMIVPGFLVNIITGALTNSLVPKIVGKSNGSPEAEFRNFISATLFAILLLIAFVSIILFCTQSIWLEAVILRLDQSSKQLAKNLLVPGLIYFFLQAAPVVLRVILTSSHHQIIATVGPVINSIILLFLLISTGTTQVDSYVWQLSISYFLEFLFLLSATITFVKMKFHFNFKKSDFKELFDQHFWAPTASSILSASTLMLDQAMAARLHPGGVVALSYGLKITSAIVGVSAGAMGYLIFPELSFYAVREQWTDFKARVKFNALLVFAVSSMISLFCVYFSHETIQLLFERGAFRSQDTTLVSKINAFYILQIPFYLVGQVGLKALYSLKKGYRITHLTIGNVIVNAIGNYVFSIYLGLPGISLSTSLVMAFSMSGIFLMLFGELKKIQGEKA